MRIRRQNMLVPAVVLLWTTACGELSRSPGAVDAGGEIAEDAGVASTRRKCNVLCIEPAEGCLNGECVSRCSSGQLFDCTGSDVCSGGVFCVAPVTPTCVDSPCNADQRCVSEICVLALDVSCSDDTACAPSGQCDGVAGRCVGLAPCSADHSCPLGTRGAVCNRDANGFARVQALSHGRCLIGYCAGDEHCPAPLKCLDVGAVNEGVGHCR